MTVLAIPINVPAGANCLSFDFRFLSEEYPDFIDSQFNDAFIAELDSSTWVSSGPVITGLENDFALDANGRPADGPLGQAGLSARRRRRERRTAARARRCAPRRR